MTCSLVNFIPSLGCTDQTCILALWDAIINNRIKLKWLINRILKWAIVPHHHPQSLSELHKTNTSSENAVTLHQFQKCFIYAGLMIFAFAQKQGERCIMSYTGCMTYSTLHWCPKGYAFPWQRRYSHLKYECINILVFSPTLLGKIRSCVCTVNTECIYNGKCNSTSPLVIVLNMRPRLYNSLCMLEHTQKLINVSTEIRCYWCYSQTS